MKTPLEIAADNFHAHLDVCQQCEGHPFELCATGQSAAAGGGRLTAATIPPIARRPM